MPEAMGKTVWFPPSPADNNQPKKMHTQRSEYIPRETETDNGNGNGHAKIFALKPATDPDTLLILETRRRANSDDRLNRSMKACFLEIVDRALNPNFFDYKGVVTLSDTFLADIFGVSNRSVYNWKKQIAECGYVWLTRKFKSNMWPITQYHLTCLHKPRREEKTDPDGTYGGGKFRPAPVNPGVGARKPGQPGLSLPGSRQPPPETKSDEMKGISAQNRKKLPVSPETNFGSEPKPISGESRNPLRARAETVFGSEPKSVAGES